MPLGRSLKLCWGRSLFLVDFLGITKAYSIYPLFLLLWHKLDQVLAQRRDEVHLKGCAELDEVKHVEVLP